MLCAYDIYYIPYFYLLPLLYIVYCIFLPVLYTVSISILHSRYTSLYILKTLLTKNF